MYILEKRTKNNAVVGVHLATIIEDINEWNSREGIEAVESSEAIFNKLKEKPLTKPCYYYENDTIIENL